MSRSRIAVEVRVVRDPVGELGVLMQVRDGEGWWLVLKPNDARLVADSLNVAAKAVEEAARAEG